MGVGGKGGGGGHGAGGGGGGGGYYGGGGGQGSGGWGGAGGGGSSLVPPFAQTNADFQDGDGQVILGWTSIACDNDGVLDAGEACDLGTQNGVAGSCCSSTCQFVSVGTQCRAAGGACDVAESCDGVSAACPSDTKAASGAACGDASDDACTDPDTCDGAGTCASNHATAGTACPSDSEVCTRDICDNTGTCSHPAGNSGTECRAASGECDLAERCDGTKATCPSDTKAVRGAACGDTSDDTCTDPDTCDGAGTCEPNHAAPGMACSSDSRVCTLDACDGAGSCAHPAGNNGTECRAASGACDLAERCDGTSTACPSDAAKPNGTSCDDGNACSGGTVCTAGECGGGTTVDCGPCERCTGAGGCEVAPRDNCKEVVGECTSRLKIFDNVVDIRDKLDWEWRSGGHTTWTDFDDPTSVAGGSDYALCLFDDPTGTPRVLLSAEVAAGEGWKRLGTGGNRGFRWQGRSGAGSDGLTKIDLRPGADGKAYVRVQGQGEALQIPALPAALPLSGAAKLQLGASGGACWQATFNSASCGMIRNGATLFYGAGD